MAVQLRFGYINTCGLDYIGSEKETQLETEKFGEQVFHPENSIEKPQEQKCTQNIDDFNS